MTKFAHFGPQRIPRLLTFLLIACLAFITTKMNAQSTNSAHDEIQTIVQSIQSKITSGKKAESDVATELKQLDDLLARQNGEKTETSAEIIYVKAMIFAQLFNDFDKAIVLIKEIKSDYPNTNPGHDADKILSSLAGQAATQKIQAGFAVGATFPGFSEKDLNGHPLATSDFKGKILLIDFWATWCPPCRAELPNVTSIYKKYHAQGFEIIGVSLDSDQDKLQNFIKEHDMTWPQFFDGQGWSNKLVVKYGVESIPFTILLDGNGKIIAKDIRGDDLAQAVSTALNNK